MDRKQILIPGSLWQRLPLLVFFLFTATAGAAEAGGPWKKHVVLSAAETGGGVNTVLANDFDGDGKLDIISSFSGKVVLLKGPDWKQRVIVHKLPTSRPGRPGRGCIHSTLLDVDGDGDLDVLATNSASAPGKIYWLITVSYTHLTLPTILLV